jgi:hypothetical protein
MNMSTWCQKTRWIAVTALVMLAAHFAAVTRAQADPKSIARGWNNAAIGWMDHTQGVAEAARTGKPILTIVQTTW